MSSVFLYLSEEIASFKQFVRLVKNVCFSKLDVFSKVFLKLSVNFPYV